MSLMLDALKRIEAKQSRGRASAAVAEIELPPEFQADAAADLTVDDVALPGDVSLETAMDDLAALLAEARLLDQPPLIVQRDSPILADARPASRPLLHSGAHPGGRHEVADAKIEPVPIPSLDSDPYAATAWRIVQQLPQGRSQLVLFTSPGDGQGKTTTLARLLPHVARSFSGSILAVDANSGNPELARRLDVASTWRLTDVLAGATHWMNAVRPTALPRVSLLGGGTASWPRPNVDATARLLRELAGHFDLVLVDAGSLTQDGTALLAAAGDGAYLVVRLGECGGRIVREAVRVIGNAGGRLLGCIAIDAGAWESAA